MKLIVAHQILIGSAIGLAAFFALRAAALFARGEGSAHLGVAIGAAIAGALLGLYLRALRARLAREKRGA